MTTNRQMRHVTDSCVTFALEMRRFAPEIASRAPRGKFAENRKASRTWRKPSTRHMAQKCLICAPESVTFAPEIGGFAAVLLPGFGPGRQSGENPSLHKDLRIARFRRLRLRKCLMVCTRRRPGNSPRCPGKSLGKRKMAGHSGFCPAPRSRRRLPGLPSGAAAGRKSPPIQCCFPFGWTAVEYSRY